MNGEATEPGGYTGGNVDVDKLGEAVELAIGRMETIMITSINYNTDTTAITTLLGQNANRAAKQTPQG